LLGLPGMLIWVGHYKLRPYCLCVK
jgi:hypothetical protein